MNKQTKFGIWIVIATLCFGTTVTAAQDVTTVSATSEEISDNLNLEAVASIFGDAKDLEDFEKRLNDPETQISNLDLNGDSEVDYLRVMEAVENGTHLVAVQAVLGEDLYQDVATLEVEKDIEGNTQVQVVGDVYLYGPNYIIEPIYVHRPIIFGLFWRPYYRPYRSVFHWGYYPRYHRFWRPFKVPTYHKQVHVHVNVNHSFHRVQLRRSATAVRIHTNVRRNDYGTRYPNRSYTARTASVRKTNGSTKRVTTVKRTNGTTKKVASVQRPNGSSKTVAVKKKPNGSKTVVSVNKRTNGTKTVRKKRTTKTVKKRKG
ncbi:MAG: hypothetical protein AAFZ89_10285 [Bacteroidota bacterium]